MKESELINQLQEKESLIDSQNKMLTEQKSSFNKYKEQLSDQVIKYRDSEIDKCSKKESQSPSRNTEQMDNPMREFSELKNEIQRLTESLSGFAAFANNVQKSQ